MPRDDLSDGGFKQFCRCVRALRACSPETLPELLVPDFKGKEDALEKIAADGRFRFDIGAMPALVR